MRRVAIAFALSACTPHEQPPPFAQAAPPSASAPSPPIFGHDASAPPAPAKKEEGCLELEWSRTRCAKPFKAKHPVGALEWLAKRGIKVQDGVAIPSKAFEHVDYEGGCEPIAIGGAREEALACAFGYGTMDGVAIGGFRIITVRKGQIMSLLDVIDSIGNMPVAPGQADAFPLLFGLDSNIENAEREIVVSQPSRRSCAEAKTVVKDNPALRRWLEKVCHGARRYVFTNDTFAAAR